MYLLSTAYIFLFSLPLICEFKNESVFINDDFDDISKVVNNIKTDLPQNVTLETESSSSLLLKWEPPFNVSLHSITGYIIKFRPKLNSKTSETVFLDGKRKFYQIKNLKKATFYNVKIATIINNETIAFSDWYSAQTAEHDFDESQTPGKLEKVFLTPISSSLIVSWNPPVNQSIVIRGYTISWGKGVPEKYTKILDPKKLSHTLENLTPLSEYVVSLQAFNNKGDGPPVYETAWTNYVTTPEPKSALLPPVGLKATVLSSTSIILYWTDSTLLSNDVNQNNRYYKVRYTSNVHSNNPKYRYHNSTQLNYIIDDLKPNTQYEFAVKLIKGKRESTWSMTVINSTFEAIPSSAPRDLTIVSSDNDDPSILHLHWQPPKQPNGQITGYDIYYTIDESFADKSWMIEAMTGDKMTAILKNLIPDTVYYFKIKVKNNKGYGPFSQTVSRKTLSADKKLKTTYVIGIAAFFVVVAMIFIFLAILLYKSKRKGHPYINRKHKGYMATPTNLNGKSKNTKELKSPDLWIHHNGHLELKGLTSEKQGDSGASTKLEQDLILHGNTLEKGKKINFTEVFYDDVHKSSSSPTDTSASLTSGNSILRRSLKTKPIVMSVDGTSTSTSYQINASLDFEPSTNLSRPIYPRTQLNIQKAHVTLNSKDISSNSNQNHLYDAVASTPLPMGIGNNLSGLNTSTPSFQNSFNSMASPNASALRLINSSPLKSFSISSQPPPPPPPPPPLLFQELSKEQTQFGQLISPIKKLSTSNSNGSTEADLSPNKLTANSTFEYPVNQIKNNSNRITISDSLKKEVLPTYSTEDLNQEMVNLEDLMKDLNAITSSEFLIKN